MIHKSSLLKVFIVACATFFTHCGNSVLWSNSDIYSSLDKIKNNRRNMLVAYADKLNKKVDLVGNDSLFLTLFNKKQMVFQNNDKNTQEIIDYNLERQCIYKHARDYSEFSNVIFIDINGHILHTIVKQLSGPKNQLGETYKGVCEKLIHEPETKFIDFYFIDNVDEPAAFFVHPIKRNRQHVGWIVLQLAINKIDNMLSIDDNLGKTGEVILVNKSRYLLNNSRFYVDNTILKIRLSDKNIKLKFTEKIGHKNVIDYRGENVNTSFEVFTFLNTEWLLIVKIDENETFTRFYKENRKRLKKELLECINSGDYEYTQVSPPNSDFKRVDIDEFQRTESDKILYTQSVFTCTAISIVLPDKFAYLAHIGTSDRIYNKTETDILQSILKQITDKELYPVETQNLQIAIFAPHTNTIGPILDKLISYDIFLSQIKFIFNTEAVFVDVSVDFEDNEIIAYWKRKLDEPRFFTQTIAEEQCIGTKLKRHLQASGDTSI